MKGKQKWKIRSKGTKSLSNRDGIAYYICVVYTKSNKHVSAIRMKVQYAKTWGFQTATNQRVTIYISTETIMQIFISTDLFRKHGTGVGFPGNSPTYIELLKIK